MSDETTRETLERNGRPFRSGLGRRDEFLANVPSWYNGWAQLAFTSLVGGAAIVWVLSGLRHARLLELAVPPLAFLIANGIEWWVHKGPLHRRGRVEIAYVRHTLLHHAAFSTQSMAIRSQREMRMVLFPVPALIGAAVVAAAVGLLVGRVCSENAGRLWFSVWLGYYVFYEWCHLAFHMPPRSWLGRNPITRLLQTTHTRHHEPSAMMHRNFNVTFPIFDLLMGTLDRR